MIELKYSEILQRNKAFNSELDGSYNISVISNVMVTTIQPILEYNLKLQGIPAKCKMGDYDNIMQDSSLMKHSNVVLIFWELANLIDGFQYRSNLFTKDQTIDYINRFKSEIDYVFSQLKNTPLVLLNKFSTLVFNHFLLEKNNFDHICEVLNEYIKLKATPNIIVIDSDKVMSRISIEKSVNFRDYYSSKALFTVEYMKHYVSYITPIIASINGKRKKAIVFDCDNTLWEGILGEDGENGIKMSASSPKGAVFEEVQFLAKELASKGILVALNSKNNLEDVNEIFDKHPDISLSAEEVTIKMINWEEKVRNLQHIAQELNIGIDSLVFVDDSDFEINLVNEYQPQVETIQVPKERYFYPNLLRQNLGFFYSFEQTQEDKDRTLLYQQQRIREENKETFDNIDEYLESLGLRLKIFVDNLELVTRMAQLTQKTNQFNLTTIRYTETEISAFIESDKYRVYCFGVSDKYGDYGITGLAIISLDGPTATIDTLLMSCRVLGRNIELRFLDEIVDNLKANGLKNLNGKYFKTQKNQQVEFLFDKLGFDLIKQNGDHKEYTLELINYQFHPFKYILTNYA
jgi:FkbH-like protein